MTRLPPPRFYAMGSRCTQARFLNVVLRSGAGLRKSQPCARCEELGLSPHDIPVLDKLRNEPAPAGEEHKARAFKDGLTAQSYV
jgi:hypothetical protein